MTRSSSTCLAAGGTVTLSNGQLYGDVVYLAGASISSDVNFATGGSAAFGAPYNYGNVAMGLTTGPFVTALLVGASMQNWRRRLRGETGDTRPTGGYR